MQPLTPDDLAAALEPAMPTAKEMKVAFMHRLYAEVDSMKGVALVQGLTALERLVKAEEAEPEVKAEDARLSVADRVHALPPDHARTLVQAEIVRLEAEVARLYEALKGLDG